MANKAIILEIQENQRKRDAWNTKYAPFYGRVFSPLGYVQMKLASCDHKGEPLFRPVGYSSSSLITPVPGGREWIDGLLAGTPEPTKVAPAPQTAADRDSYQDTFAIPKPAKAPAEEIQTTLFPVESKAIPEPEVVQESQPEAPVGIVATAPAPPVEIDHPAEIQARLVLGLTVAVRAGGKALTIAHLRSPIPHFQIRDRETGKVLKSPVGSVASYSKALFSHGVEIDDR